MGFDAVRSTYGVSGVGVTIGVISDGIFGLGDAVTSGDLPATTLNRDGGGTLVSTSGGVIAISFRADGDLEGGLGGGTGAEGTAILEIVHDIAPGAQLRFANFQTELEFMAAVDFLAANSDVVIDDIGFEGSGCAISRASASMMTEALKGKTAAEARQIFDAFRQMLTNPGEEYDADTLGDLEVLSGVSEFPIRIKCATLAWHTLKATLDGEKKAVATE